MSEFLAEARVLVRPDTTAFRAQLQAQVAAATAVPLTVPVAIQAVGAAAGVAAATAATTGLEATQQAAQASTLGLASAAQVENSAFGRQAVILETVSAATTQLAGSQAVLDRTQKRMFAGTTALDAGLLGLRTAAGSAAVIGLGALSLAAIVVGKALRGLVDLTAQFETELNTFRAVTDATADEMERVSEAAIALGQDVRLPAVSAGDAAIAMTELARAGLSVEDAVAGAEGVLQLATAAQLENADAARIAANALNAFGLAGEDAVAVADAFANAANAAQGSIADIGIAFRQASAAARQVGLSLQDTTAILAIFARNGLTGSDAGTALRTALIRLVAPTDQAAAKIRELGLDIRDAQGNVRADVFAQFGEATENLTRSQQDAAAALIFGQDAFRAVAIGAREGASGLRLMQFEIDQTGTASEVAAARTEGFAGAVGGLQSNLETLAVTIGGPVNRSLATLAKGASTAVTGIDRIAVSLGRFGDAAAKPLSPEGSVGGFFQDLGEQVGDAVGPITRLRDRFRDSIDGISSGALSGAQRIRALQRSLQDLQEARLTAERGGQRGIADQLTKEIKALREEIGNLQNEAKGISATVTTPLEESLAALQRVRAVRIQLGIDTTPIDRLIASLKESIPISAHVEGNFNRLRDDFGGAGDAAAEAAPKIKSLAAVLKELQAASSGIQAEVLRLETEGGTPGQLIAALSEDIEAQRDIIRRAQARGGKGAATAIEDARNQIKSDQAQIASLQSEITQDAEEAADKAEAESDRRDTAIQRQLEAATRPLERALDRASLTESLRDDLRFTTALIELYKKQITEAAKRIKDVETRNTVIDALEDDLFQAILDRRKLQQENRDRIRAALEERQEELVRAAEIRVEFADLAENVKKGVQARLRLIAALKREARVLKLQGNALLENKLERARIRKEIRDLLDESKEDQNIGKQINFRILQQAQGFATSIMSNLIPASATAGALAGRGPSAAPQEGIRREAGLAAGRDTTVSRGQGNETNAILRSILRQLENLNGRTLHPEATRQRRQQGASQDTVAL